MPIDFPASPTTGQTYTFNNRSWTYNGSAWDRVPANTSPSGAFVETDNTINANYTISAGKNAMSAGPITIANGVTVTIPDGQTWVIVG